MGESNLICKSFDLNFNKEELDDVVHWVRQVLGAVIGLLWGFLGLEGFMAIGTFGILNVLIMFIYYTKYLGVDDEEFGRTDLVLEGFMSSFAIYLICWISTYNLLL